VKPFFQYISGDDTVVMLDHYDVGKLAIMTSGVVTSPPVSMKRKGGRKSRSGQSGSRKINKQNFIVMMLIRTNEKKIDIMKTFLKR